MNDIIFEKQNGGMGRTAPNADPVSGLLMALNYDIVDSLEKFDNRETNGLRIAKMKYFEQLSAQFKIEETGLKEFDKLDKQIKDLDEEFEKFCNPEEPNATPTQDEIAAKEKEIDADKEKVKNEIALRQEKNAIVYHVREFFRMSPEGTLYLAIKPATTEESTGEGEEVILTVTEAAITADDIKTLQYYAGGEIRQVGVFTRVITGDELEDYQDACTNAVSGLFAEHQPLSVIVTYTVDDTVELEYFSKDENSLVVPGHSNVSILISRDLDEELDDKMGSWANYGCIGTLLGAVSNAMVHESIAWVQKFPLSLKVPGFITGEPVNKVNNSTQNLINDLRYIFVRTHVGNANNYFNDSFTLDEGTSDYAFIENVRTMDKATRGIRTNLLPHLNSPLYVDPATGKLRSDTVAYLETVAGRALEDMEKAGELSGYKVVIDPAQNVLATSTLEIVIKNVPVGVMRKVIVKIGYTTKL